MAKGSAGFGNSVGLRAGIQESLELFGCCAGRIAGKLFRREGGVSVQGAELTSGKDKIFKAKHGGELKKANLWRYCVYISLNAKETGIWQR